MIRNLSLLIVSVMFSLFSLEVGLRIIGIEVPYQYMPTIVEEYFFAPSAYQTFTLKKNYTGRFITPEFNVEVKTNEEGLRDDPINMNKSRLLMLGDSFTFGFGLEKNETFSNVLESEMHGWDVVNAGYASGNSPDSYHTFLLNRFQNILPEVIVIKMMRLMLFFSMSGWK